jgi:hypothetical protein
VITDAANCSNDAAGGDYAPLSSIGSIGDYAVIVAVDANLPGYYKNSTTLGIYWQR